MRSAAPIPGGCASVDVLTLAEVMSYYLRGFTRGSDGARQHIINVVLLALPTHAPRGGTVDAIPAWAAQATIAANIDALRLCPPADWRPRLVTFAGRATVIDFRQQLAAQFVWLALAVERRRAWRAA